MIFLLTLFNAGAQEVWFGGGLGFGFTVPQGDDKLYSHGTSFGEIKIIKNKSPFLAYYSSVTHGQLTLAGRNWDWTNNITEVSIGIRSYNSKRRGFAEAGVLIGSFWSGNYSNSKTNESISVDPKSPQIGFPLSIGARFGPLSFQYFYIYRVSDFRPTNNPISNNPNRYSIKSTGAKVLIRLK